MKFSCQAAFLALFLAVSGASSLCQGAQQPAAKPPFEYRPCDPVVSGVLFGHDGGEVLSARISLLFEQDQSREKNMPPPPASTEVLQAYWTKTSAEDHQRQVEVMGYLREGKVNSADDLYHAAMIFQHGHCPDHFKLANALAEKAMEKGSDPAKWLYAATLDRYLMSQGKPQKFGTQFVRPGNATEWELYAIDPATTDEDRARYHVPSLAVQKQKLERMNQPQKDSSKDK